MFRCECQVPDTTFWNKSGEEGKDFNTDVKGKDSVYLVKHNIKTLAAGLRNQKGSRLV